MGRFRLVFAAAVAVAAAVLFAVGTNPIVLTAAPGDIDWPTISFDIQRTAVNPQEATINAGNASQLREKWAFAADGIIDSSAVVASNVAVTGAAQPVDIVYVGSEHGTFYALNAANGQLIWKKYLGSIQTTCFDLPDAIFGITSAAAIDRGANRIYVAGGDGAVHALDLSTGAESAGWPVAVISNPHQEHVWSGLTLAGSRLYAETAGYCDITPYHGQIAEIDIPTATVAARFYPAGPPNNPHSLNGGAIWGWAGASVDGGGNVYVATGNALPDAMQTYLYSEHVVQLTADLGVLAADAPPLVGPDVDYGSTPTLFQAPGCPAQFAVENKSGVLFIFNRDAIGQGPVQRLQLADVNDDEFVGNPSWSPATNMLYVANSSDSNSALAPAKPVPGPFQHGMVALHEGSDCRFTLAWQNPTGPSHSVLSLPVNANGVVYYGDGTGNRVIAFDAVTGQQLWASKNFHAPVFAEPIVVNGQVFSGAWDQMLHAFSID